MLPDETIAFYASDGGPEGCDDIKERAPNGTIRTIVNSQRALGTTGFCHVNDIQYSKVDDTLVFSDHVHCAVAKVKRSDGTTVWVLNGATKTFTGDFWPGSQHGIHIQGIDDFLIFNNNSRTGEQQHGDAGRDRGRIDRDRDQARPQRQDRRADLVLQGDGPRVPDRHHGRLAAARRTAIW